jgi:SNF2 family DNA or RNA helicase
MYFTSHKYNQLEWLKIMKYHVADNYSHILNCLRVENIFDLRFSIAEDGSIILVKEGQCAPSFELGSEGRVRTHLFDFDSKLRYRIKFCTKDNRLFYNLYINRQYIDSLCRDNYCAPELIRSIVTNSCVKTETGVTIDKIPTAINVKLDALPIESILRSGLFQHQRNNINWMKTVERNVTMGSHVFSYINTSNLLYINHRKINLYMNRLTGSLYDENIWNFPEYVVNLSFKGGVLCDEVGLGKTLSMIGLILSNRKTDIITKAVSAPPASAPPASAPPMAKPSKKIIILKKKATSPPTSVATPPTTSVATVATPPTTVAPSVIRKESTPTNDAAIKTTIVICPRRLAGQWASEIEKYVGSKLSVCEITTMAHINRLSVKQISEADVVITTFNLFSNKSYLDQRKLRLEDIYWYRVIVDEGHEILLSTQRNMEDSRQSDGVMNVHGRYKWNCTGTPLPLEKASFHGLSLYLRDVQRHTQQTLTDNLTEPNFRELSTLLFRRSTKESTQGEIFIPSVIVKTDSLEFTPTERAIYNAALAQTPDDKTRLIQLCSNVLVSDYDTKIVGGASFNLGDINSSFLQHYQTKLTEFKDLLLSKSTELDETEIEKRDTIAEFDDMLSDMKRSGEPKDKIDACKEEREKVQRKFYSKMHTLKQSIDRLTDEIEETKKQIRIFAALDISSLTQKCCPLTSKKLLGNVIVTPVGDYYDHDAVEALFGSRKKIRCPRTGAQLSKSDLIVINTDAGGAINPSTGSTTGRWGTKMSHMINDLNNIISENPDHRVIIFSQWNKMLQLVSTVLEDEKIRYVLCRGNVHVISKSIRNFKTDPKIKVILLSSENCSSGSNLTEATHIILLDAFNSDPENAKAIEDQAIARAVRLGQKYNVIVKKYIMKDTIEEEFNNKLLEI